MRRVLLTAVPLLCACVHGAPVPDGGDDSWIEPGHTYRGEVVGHEGPFDRFASFRVRTDLAQRLTFRIRTQEGPSGRAVRLTRPDEQFGPEVADVSHDVGGDTVTMASIVPPEDGTWVLAFSPVAKYAESWTYELEFLPRGEKLGRAKLGETSGALTDDDAQDEFGRRSDTYRLAAGDDSKKYRITLKTKGFTGYVRVRKGRPDGPLERRGWSDDYDEWVGSLSGDVFLEVRGSEDSSRGAYTLEVADAAAEEIAQMPELAPGTPVEGRFGADGRMVHYKLRGTPGRQYAIEAKGDVDMYVFVHDWVLMESGPMLRLGGRAGSVIRGVAAHPEEGTWVVSLVPAKTGATGSFRVSYEPVP